MDIIVCNECGGGMRRFEMVKDRTDSPSEGLMVEKDWSLEVPICPVCRGVPGATEVRPNHDVMGGFAWKRDAGGKKVPRG